MSNIIDDGTTLVRTVPTGMGVKPQEKKTVKRSKSHSGAKTVKGDKTKTVNTGKDN